jgi:two-component system cell cycle response regulator
MNDSFPVLIADDNAVSRRRLELTLKKAGYEVTSVDDGKKALDIFNERFFPVVITDWVMPELEGPSFCRAIRNAETPGYVYIIILTAKESKSDIVMGLESGADDYLKKPFHDAELKARLKTGLRILELERSLRRANDEVKRLSIIDPLTGCYNRGYLDTQLTKELKRALRYKNPLSIVMTDIDHFKTVNDRFGHRCGDRVLKEFIRVLSGSIRKDLDWIARYGGEEFVIVLPETDLKGAATTASRLREATAENRIPFDHSMIQVTASFGACSISEADGLARKESGTSLAEQFIQCADVYLYKSKESGRNCVYTGPFVP